MAVSVEYADGLGMFFVQAAKGRDLVVIHASKLKGPFSYEMFSVSVKQSASPDDALHGPCEVVVDYSERPEGRVKGGALTERERALREIADRVADAMRAAAK